jgi:hypothetical protein
MGSVFDWKNDQSPSLMAKDLGTRQRAALKQDRKPTKHPFRPVVDRPKDGPPTALTQP